MFNFKTLKCNYCDTVITNLPEAEITKLDGLTFICECCNHANVLKDSEFHKCTERDSTSIFALLDESLSA